MALDRTSTDVYYLTGRYIAVVEKSNNKKMSGVQMDNLFRNPSLHMERYDLHHFNYEKEREEILSKMPAEGFPKRTNSEQEGIMWIGYHHQRYVLPDVTVEKHCAEHVECAAVDNNIAELKK